MPFVNARLLNSYARFSRRLARILPTYGAIRLARSLPSLPQHIGVVTAPRGDFVSLCTDREDIISKCLYWFGRFDPWVASVACRAVGPGCQALDIGANLGAVTLPLAQAVGPRGRVWSFEPDETNFARLSANVAANSLRNVQAARCAVSSASFVRIVSQDGDPGHISTAPSSEHAPGVVQARTLDSICDQIKSDTGSFVALCKIDVEGSELDVLRSGEAALASKRLEVILFESHEGVKPGHPVTDILLGFNYEIFRIHKLAYGVRLVPIGSTSKVGIATQDYVAYVPSSPAAGRLHSLLSREALS